MSQLNFHRGPLCQRVIAPRLTLIAPLSHPQKLFDINCGSHIISCQPLSGIYDWSHWLEAEPPIKSSKSPMQPGIFSYQLSIRPSASRLSMQICRWAGDMDYAVTQISNRADIIQERGAGVQEWLWVCLILDCARGKLIWSWVFLWSRLCWK